MQFLIFSLLGLCPRFSRLSHSPVTRALVFSLLAFYCTCLKRKITECSQSSIREINCVIQWIEIDPVDSAIHLLNNYRARLNLFPEFNESKTKTNFIKL